MTTNHITSISIKSVPVLDQDEALSFYTEQLGFEVREDIDLGFMRWLTVGVPQHDADTAAQVRELDTLGALGGLFLTSSDIRATYDALDAAGVEITQEPVEQPYGSDMAIRDPFGNHVRISQLADVTPEQVQEKYDSSNA